jgi:uncharacterized protein YaaW (UPF0174 family)
MQQSKNQEKSKIIECSSNDYSDTLNLYVHGYSAIRHEDEEQALVQKFASVPDINNWFYVWDSGHFFKHLSENFSLIPSTGLPTTIPSYLFIQIAEQLLKIAKHFLEMQKKAEYEGKNHFFELLEAHLNKRSKPFKKINIIGHSLGARLVYTAIKANPSISKKIPIENIIFLGGAVDCKADWDLLLSTIQGKIYNCYSKNDHILRIKPNLEICIGRNPIDLNNHRIQNHLFTIGHTHYWDNLLYILEQIQINQSSNTGMVLVTEIVSDSTDLGLSQEDFDKALEEIPNLPHQAQSDGEYPLLDSKMLPYFFAINDEDLYPILYQAKPHELSKIAEIIAQKSSSSISASEQSPYKIADEIQRMGGDSLMNLKRGHGVSYREIVLDILSIFHIKPQNHQKYTIDSLEAILLNEMLKAYYDGLDEKEKKEFENTHFDQDYPTFDLLTPQVKAYILRQAFIKVGLSILMTMIVRRMAIALIPGIGPISLAAFLATLLTGPAYLTTMPCMICIAEIRSRLNLNDLS